MSQRFTYAVDIKFAFMWLPFGVRPSKDGVTITDDGLLKTTFGFLRLETPLDNVSGAHITRDYRWWTAIGARTSFVDDGLSFGTNTKAAHTVKNRASVFTLRPTEVFTLSVLALCAALLPPSARFWPSRGGAHRQTGGPARTNGPLTVSSHYTRSLDSLLGDPNGGERTQWPRHDSAADEMIDLTNTGAVVRPDPLKARLGPHPSSAPAHRATRAIAKVVRAAVGSPVETGDEKGNL